MNICDNIITNYTSNNDCEGNILNLTPSLLGCYDYINTPDVIMLSGFNHHVSGLTTSSEGIYNLDINTNVSSSFLLTGDTTVITTASTGTFTYIIYPKDISNPISEIYYVSPEFPLSGVTNNLVNDNFSLLSFPKEFREYYVKYFFRFNSSVCQDFFEINTYNNFYEPNKDKYLVTLLNPPKPVIFPNPNALIEGVRFINETLEIQENNVNLFTLSFIPLNSEAIITVNGVALGENEYSLNNNVLIIVTGSIDFDNDIITASYLYDNTGNLNLLPNTVSLETYIITGITNDLSGSSVNDVSYNTTFNRYEFFLNNIASNTSDIILQINGVFLSFNQEFFLSQSVPNRINFASNIVLNVGDAISVFYIIDFNFVTSVNLGLLDTLTPYINWYITEDLPLNVFNGVFSIEVANLSATTYNPLMFNYYTNHLPTQLDYSYQIGPLVYGLDYRVRIGFSGTYVTDLNEFTTFVYSNEGFFSTNNPSIINGG
jgi:hypothetical protein